MPRRFRERLDERGEIRIPAPPVGGYGLVIEAGEVAPQLTATLVITEGELAPVVIQVPSGASWTCVVHRADGTEWSDHAIRVDGIGGDATTARTDEHGFVRIPVLKRGRKTVVGMIRDGWFSIGTIDVPERGTLHSDLRLPGRAALRARVVRDGKPVRVPLVLCLQSDPDVYAYQIPDGDGRVAMDDLAAGSYALETRGDSIARLRTVALRDGDTVDLGDLDLGAASSVRVEVVVPEGAKMPKGFHAYATIAGLDGKAREQVALVWLDEQGRGVVADLPAGTHKVRVSTPGFTDAEVVLAVPSTEPVKIALEPSVQVGR
jgi:hypothetical protein